MILSARPLPIIEAYDRPFWEAVSLRTFSLQQCDACIHVWYPPGPVCPRCLSEKWQWRPVTGKGRIVAWTTFHRQYFEEFPVPHVVVSVELEEGPLVIADLANSGTAQLRLDAPVSIRYVPVTSGTTEWLIYQWVLDTNES
ncbi:hypothetical protein AWB78_06195 [Caballeronia calidae]|uniref:DUF35 domain-containing protein n=1 Tax=Caballeronia calidae TaxID=1777139 RepID=A0A158E4L9_9BURK|nr:hypothetical protein AWB78_06195 [Caballeronia calidae]